MTSLEKALKFPKFHNGLQEYQKYYLKKVLLDD